MNMFRSSIVALAMAMPALAASPEDAHAQRRQRDRITREEILASAHANLDLYQVIRSLRPHFLEPPKGVRSFNAANTPVALYVDGKRDIGLDALKTMVPARVAEIRYLDPSRSESEYGPVAAGGAVVVKLHKEPARQAGEPAPSPDTTRPPRR